MTQRKDKIGFIVLVVFALGGMPNLRELNAAESNPSQGHGVAQATNESEEYAYRIANPHIQRVIRVSRGRLTTKEIGRPDDPVAVAGGLEFSVVVGPSKTRLSSEDFRVTSVTSAEHNLNVVLQQRAGGLTAQVEYRLARDEHYIRKTITFRNNGPSLVQLLDIDVESLQFADAKALGLGKPVYAEGKLFLGLEFPLGRNEQNGGLITLRHLPGTMLQPGETLVSKIAVVGAASHGETVEAAFDRYIRRIALRKPEVMTVYGNWARYDYISDGVWPDEKMVFETVGELSKMQTAGWRPDYYVMDAGWFDKKGDYTDYVKPAWPNGPRPMVKGINDIGMKYGLWFEVGGGIPDNPRVQSSKTDAGRLCLVPGPYLETFKKGLTRQIEDFGLTMIKFDFATFDCNSNQHGHLPGEYGTEASLSGFLNMIDAVRRDHPQIKYIIFNGFHRSPWWLMHVDTIYSNDPAPWDYPSLRLRDSINLKTDKSIHEHHFDHLLPWYTIDDCGLMIGRTGTIYWNGAEEFRKGWVLNIGRGNMMPFIYGDLRLLSEPDRRFIARIWNILRENADVFANTRPIGKVNGADIYGYSHFKNQHGFVFLNNPTFEGKNIVLKLDASIGLSAIGKSRLGVWELFPVECTYAASDEAGFSPDGEIRLNLAPFEVRALEIKPATGDVVGAIPPRAGAYRSITIPVQLQAKDRDWITDANMDRVQKEQAHLTTSTTAKVEHLQDLTRSRIKGVYSFSVQLPKFDKPWTLAIPLRFMAGHRPVRNNRPTACALAVAWSEDSQLMLDVTPEYGRTIWSGCSWLTLHARLDPSLSGKRIDVLALNLGLEGAGLEIANAYLLDDLALAESK